TCSLFALSRDHARAELGYALRPAYWRQGLATQMLTLALGHAFTALGLLRIEADVDPLNLASCRLLERLGFVREGLLRERWRVGGATQDSALYGLLARDWRAPSRP
ncbi:MAG: GNAT family N-acetyltransferase, partial [Rhodanobacteraceae bacterium]|nr:GNAT family N-acetyltransferase [Rhodanobacteraceae bacterium]